jgi:RimJ/RimL family protein N-acetyltransferase
MDALAPCTLVGRYVELEPLQGARAEAILAAGEGVDWGCMAASLTTKEGVVSWMATSQRAWERGEEFAFVVKLRPGSGLAAPPDSGGVIGSTRYMDIQASHKGVEIGWTWYSPSLQGTVVNPECKFLLLKHAFEDWGAARVQIKTDVRNERSQRAILKLGAKFEGKLRNHRIRRDGTLRDTMMYSITREEWPEVRAGLAVRIESWRPG